MLRDGRLREVEAADDVLAAAAVELGEAAQDLEPRGVGERGKPLGERRPRLNGSGLLLVRPPEGALEALGASAAVIGPRCAIREGTWSLRLVAWGPRSEAGAAPAGDVR